MKAIHNRRAGFTLLESMISITVLSIVVAGVVTATRAGAGTFKTSMANSDVEAKGRRLISKLTSELTSAQLISPDDLEPDDNASWIAYRLPTDFTAGAMTWGPTMWLIREMEPGELDNGIDDNGNGLIDEGQLVRVTDPFGENRRVVLVHGVAELLEGEESNGDDDNGNGLVDEPGLSFVFDPDGNRLSLRITVQGVDASGRLIERTTETMIGLRN